MNNLIQVLKRNSETVEFDKQKIIHAIGKAYQEVYKENLIPSYAYEIADLIYGIASDPELADTPLKVEDIQDLVEDYLTDYDRLVEKAYVRYRYKRGVMRNCSNEFIRSINEKLTAANVQNQNANVDEYSFGGRLGEASSVHTKQYALDFLLSPTARENHLNNEIYIHDLDHYALGDHNCLSIPFDDLLANGFNTRQTDVRPANSINTAFQLVAVIFQLQSLMQFGGVAATHLDWTMVPYVRKSFRKHMIDGLRYIEKIDDEEYLNSVPKELRFDDPEANSPTHAEAYEYAMDMTERELRQAVEGMYHNLNTLQSRSGNQLPFTSINYGTCTLPEGRMELRRYLTVLLRA